MTGLLVAFLVSTIAAATPLLLAATGELVVEKVGVLNLGVEGMMLAGAIAGCATANETGITALGMAAALAAGILLSLLFAVISLTLQANQTATGLALTIFGRGFSALVGAGYVGIPAPTLTKIHIPLLGHQGEPRNCWLPLNAMTVKNDQEYFTSHPQYYMYLHPDMPSYQDQIRARDHMLSQHPDLQFAGLHLASLEWSVDEIAHFLDRFPNAVVDVRWR